jgi:ABC-type Fe3+/spermidine/putrescine transport system ATPase subunit
MYGWGRKRVPGSSLHEGSSSVPAAAVARATHPATSGTLELRDVGKSYDGEPALRHLSLAVERGTYLAMLGPSGSGKSTLLRIIAGFESPDAGDVRLGGRSLLGIRAHERGIGFVFQNFALFPHFSVFENVAFGLRYRAGAGLRNDVALRGRVEAMLEMVGLAGLGPRAVTEISGGQKQRVALARTLVTDPEIILLDEPLGALDANLRERMMIELRRIHRQLGITFLHVTGNEQEALAMGDRVAVLDSGSLAQMGEPDTVYNRPASAEVARFLNCYNIFDGRIADGRFEGAAFALPCPAGAPVEAGRARYCVRFDRIRIADAATQIAAGEASFRARFVASEYDGPTITYFFVPPGGGALEVEYHLSLNRPEEFEVNRDYALVWLVDDSLVYA